MTRALLALSLLASSAVLAAPPNLSSSGVTFGLQYGRGLFAIDRDRLAAQVGDAEADLLVGSLRGTHTASLDLGYRIAGHLTLGGTFTFTGWDLGSANRGGGLFPGGYVKWHPLALVSDTRYLDVWASAGLAYGLIGQTRGAAGLLYEAGLGAELFIVPTVSVGAYFRAKFLNFDKFYVNYDQRAQPGNTLDLNGRELGRFYTAGISLNFHFGAGGAPAPAAAPATPAAAGASNSPTGG
jgi:hypothetical protein